MRIIDFHTHCYTDALAERAMRKLSESGGIAYYHDGTVRGLVQTAAEAGIELSVVMPIATKESQNTTINTWAAEVQAENDSLLCFGTVYPFTADYKAVVAQIAALGLKGVKFHPEYQSFRIDDKAVYPLYEEIAKAGLPMLFHTGGDVAYKPPFHAEPDAVYRMATDFAGAQIIAAHVGGYEFWDEAAVLLPATGIYVDLAASAEQLRGEHLRRIIEKWGSERVLFATDSPWFPQKAGIDALYSAGLSAEAYENIFHRNAERLLKLV